MAKIGTLDFTGISGHVYTFNVYPLNYTLPHKEAVYFVTHRTIKADMSVDHVLIYVGETADLTKEFKKHPKEKCFQNETANCICAYWEELGETREKIKEDLLNQYHPPCNDF